MSVGNAYDTATLVRVVRDLRGRSPGFLLSKFFPGIIEYDSEEVSIDVIVGKRRLAPFCSPLVQGKLVESRGFTTNSFKPPYIKDRRPLDPRRPLKRIAGEKLGGALSAAERELAIIEQELEDQMAMIDRRLEWMAASALATGTITVVGEGFPDTVINFSRPSGLTITLTSGDRWGEAGVSPSANIETWATTVLQESGAAVTDIVFTPMAWNYFKADPAIEKAIDFQRAGDSNVNLGGGRVAGGQYKGHWGNYALWLYNDWYIDPVDGQEKPMLADGTVLLGSEDLEGERAFGAIIDPEFAYGALAYAPKSWIEKDPARRILLMQSAPLVIPKRVGAAAAAKVR
ncbi:major capsid protein [Roseomonas terrae]|uniref:Major capsid protein n=1 Tax=Neoroseomonas terrae TaxID=424799 RepID=A0ABS5EER2_9PROT|nr:major capsid protein [Neoroseomonas terrae]MBR0649518.1 major capsid protein [Neoroseomonas terrae]